MNKNDKSSAKQIISDDMVFKKPTAAIVVKPAFGKLTAPGRKLLNVLFYLAQKQIIKMREACKLPGEMTFGQAPFECALHEILEVATPEGENIDGRYGTLQSNIRSLQMVRLEWSSPDVNDASNEDRMIWRSFVLLAGADIFVENGIKKLRWSFPHAINESLNDPKRFTYIYLKELMLLDTYCAVALYEICARYRDNPTHTTSTQTTDWWISALSGDSKIDSIKKLNTKAEINLMSWPIFKRDYLNKAIKVINAKSSMQIKLIELKNGRSIVSARFGIIRKPDINLIDVEPAKHKRTIDEIKVLNHGFLLGIKEFSLISFLEQYGVDYLSASLNKFSERANTPNSPVIQNKERYLKSILDDITPAVKIEEKPTSIANFIIDLKTQSSVVPILDKYRNIYGDLSISDRIRYKDMIEEEMRSKNMLTPNVRASLEKENFGGGVCLSFFKRMIDAGL